MSASEDTPRRFLTLEQVAEELSVGLPQVRALLKSGDLRGFQIGGRGLWRVGSQDLENFIVSAYELTAQRTADNQLQQHPPVLKDEKGHEL